MNMVDGGLLTIMFILNVLILGTSCLFTIVDKNDHFRIFITQSKLFQIDNNDLDCLRRNLKMLLSFLAHKNSEYH